MVVKKKNNPYWIAGIFIVAVILFFIIGPSFNIPLSVSTSKTTLDKCLDSRDGKLDRYEFCADCLEINDDWLTCVRDKAREVGVSSNSRITKWDSADRGEFFLLCYDQDEIQTPDEDNDHLALQVLQFCTDIISNSECSPGDEKCMGSEHFTCSGDLRWASEGEIIGECSVNCLSDQDCQNPNDYTCRDNKCRTRAKVTVFRLVGSACVEKTINLDERSEVDFDTVEECEANKLNYLPIIIGSFVMVAFVGGLIFFFIKTRK